MQELTSFCIYGTHLHGQIDEALVAAVLKKAFNIPPWSYLYCTVPSTYSIVSNLCDAIF